MAKQRISTLFVSLWQSRAMIFCTILRSLLHFGLQQWRRSNMPNTCPKFQMTWVCFTCHSAEKKRFSSPKSSPCTSSVTMQLTDLVDDLLQKRIFFFSTVGLTDLQQDAGKTQIDPDISKKPHRTWRIQDECDHICPTKCWTFFRKISEHQNFPLQFLSFFFHLFIVISPKKQSPNHHLSNHLKQHLGLPSPANGTGIPCPLESLGTGKASALMAGLSVDNDTIGPDIGLALHLENLKKIHPKSGDTWLKQQLDL